MSKTAINFILDAILAFVFLSTITVAAITRFVFPPGTVADGWILFGWTADDWSRLQFGMLFFFGVLALIHVMLHWSWVCGVVLHRLSQWRGRKVTINDSTQTLVGVAVLVGLLHIIGGVVLAAMLLIEEPVSKRTEKSRGTTNAESLRKGSMPRIHATGTASDNPVQLSTGSSVHTPRYIGSLLHTPRYPLRNSNAGGTVHESYRIASFAAYDGGDVLSGECCDRVFFLGNPEDDGRKESGVASWFGMDPAGSWEPRPMVIPNKML